MRRPEIALTCALALASCAPAAKDGAASNESASGFKAVCIETYTASAGAGLSAARSKEDAAAARLAAGMMKTRAPKICSCAEETLAEALDERGLKIAAELMPLRFSHDIAKAGGDADAMRKALDESRADGAKMIAKYSLTTAEMNKIAAATDMAVASCFAPGMRRK